MVKVGLILSGGGARAIAHLGIMKALDEHEIVFTKIAGASAGAVIAALYAAGIKPQQILELLVKLRLWSLVSPVVPRTGLLGMNSIENLLKEHLPVTTFEELEIPICISATDLNQGTSVCFTQGDLIKSLLASCCIPVLFSPIDIDGRSYIDGGILNNLPVDLIRREVDVTVALHSNPIQPGFQPSGVKSMIERTLMMAITSNVYAKKKLCDIFIEPPALGSYKILDFNKAEEIFDIGYNYAKQNFKSLGLEDLVDKSRNSTGTSLSKGKNL